MFNVSMKKSGLAAAFALATLLGWASSAQAIQVIGRWDPAYGPAFPGLGWNGEATFEVPDECLGSTGWSASWSAGSCASRVDVVSAEVNFYDVATNAALGSMEWTGDGDVPNVYLTRFGGGELESVFTGFFDFLRPDPVFAGYGGAGSGDYSFALLFAGTNVVLINRNCSGDNCQYGINDFASEAGRAVVTYTTAVPEPQTYALMLAGLGAIAFVARRRRHG
jgi:hypothetical protein